MHGAAFSRLLQIMLSVVVIQYLQVEAVAELARVPGVAAEP
jgi:hypothetical protein